MRQPTGLFGWVDLMTGDVEAARPFYEGLFGWTSFDTPTPMGSAYTQFQKAGQTVAGMSPTPPDMAAAGVPATWNSYILVDDADGVCKAVEAAGGSVPMPSMDVMTYGRMAMIADPSGAVVGLWQPRDHEGADLFNAPGSLTWNELRSRDLERARAFYSKVFGWRLERMEGDVDYYVAYLDTKSGDDKSNGGAMNVPDGLPAGTPSHWAVYFAAEDCDAYAAKVPELGGQVVIPPMDMGPGRFAGVADPTGGSFLISSFPAS